MGIRIGSSHSRRLAVLIGLTWGTAALPSLPADDPPAAATFALREVSVFEDASPQVNHELTRGARATWQHEPFAAVKTYPALHSQKPIYGQLLLAPKPGERESGAPLFFVIDESGEATAAAGTAEQEVAESPSLLARLGKALFGGDTPDELAAMPLTNTYDRLYVDLNGDRDLTNDTVVTPMKQPPASAMPRFSGLLQSVVFSEISMPLDFGPDVGLRPVRLVPRLTIHSYEDQEYPSVEFISAVARAGDIRIGSRDYRAVLAQTYVITGRYDVPSTRLLLTDAARPDVNEYWWGADQLNAMRLVDGQYYRTATAPPGDQLTVSPYQGALGTFRIGPGQRQVSRAQISGSLESRDTVLAVGTLSDDSPGSLAPVSECQLPVGDYIPNYVTVELGRLQLSISQNYHSDGQRQDIDRDAWRYGIKIRKDEPFVWDFTTPPEVLFASPAKDQTYKRGDEVSVMAVLIDPQLTIMIRGLIDTERKETKTIDLGGGRTASYDSYASLDPTVVITNSAGQQVAQGVMPFG